MDEGLEIVTGYESYLKPGDKIKILSKPMAGSSYFGDQSSLRINSFPHCIEIEKIILVTKPGKWVVHWAILDTEGYSWSLGHMIDAGAILLTPSTDIKFLEFPFEIYEKNKKYYILNNVF